MSWNPVLDPDCPIGDAVDAIETVIVPRSRDLGDSKCAVPCLRPSGKWWGLSFSSTKWGLRNF
jgi:hypothetical protein